MFKFPLPSETPGAVAKALHGLVSQIPSSAELPAMNPTERAHSLAKSAAMKAAALSGSFTLPPGPLGLATVLPDLLTVWRLQQQLVADIAAAHGRSESLTAETMILCLFKHGGAAVTQRLLSKQGEEVVINRIASRTLQQLLEKIAVRVAQRIAAKSVSRWLPIVGAVGAGAYAYYDTQQVAKNAVELFSLPLQIATTPPTEPIAVEPVVELEAGLKPKRSRQRPARGKKTQNGATPRARRTKSRRTGVPRPPTT